MKIKMLKKWNGPKIIDIDECSGAGKVTRNVEGTPLCHATMPLFLNISDNNIIAGMNVGPTCAGTSISWHSGIGSTVTHVTAAMSFSTGVGMAVTTWGSS